MTDLADTVSSNTHVSTVLGFTVLIGAGAGSFLQAGYGITQAILSPEEVTDCVGFMSIAQSLGIVVSLAIAGAIFENQAVDHVARTLPSYPRDQLRSAITGTYSSFLSSLNSPQTEKEVIHGIVEALSSVYIVVMVAGAVVTIIAILLPVRSPPFRFLRG